MKFLILTIFIFSFFCAYSDVIPRNYHEVKRSVKVENAQEFTGISLLGCVKPVNGKAAKMFVIKNNEAIHKGYKFNRFSFYVSDNEYLTSLNLDSLEPTNHNKLKFLTDTIHIGNKLIHDSVKYIREEIYYRLYKVDSLHYELHPIKSIIYSRGIFGEKSEKFDYPVPVFLKLKNDSTQH